MWFALGKCQRKKKVSCPILTKCHKIRPYNIIYKILGQTKIAFDALIEFFGKLNIGILKKKW